MDLLGIRKAVLLRPVCIIGPLQDAGWVGFLQFYFVVVFLQTFSVKGKTCTVDTHVLERRARLQSESLPFLLIMSNQIQSGRPSDTLECPGEW